MVILSMALVPLGGQVTAEDPDPKEVAITNGLAWLASAQAADGGWSPGWCDRISYTGLAVLKLETRAIELGLDPLEEAYEYSSNVTAGLSFITANSITMPIGSEPAGNPDGDADGIGIYWTTNPDCGYDWHRTYNTSIALMALSASGHPELYGDIAQDALDFIAWGQTDAGCELSRGGWRYMDNSCDSDNSNTGWVTLALGYVRSSPPYGFGLTIPPFVLTELSPWLDMMQDDVNGDPDDGGSWYDPWNPWVNILKTGNLIYEFGLVGDGVNSQRMIDAIDYMERHWMDANDDPGWRGAPANYQAMFTTMKGLEAMGIDLLDLDSDSVPEYDWFAEFVDVLVSQQNLDGSWPGWCYWGNDVACTAWALLTLEKSVPPLEIPVSIDIKPLSCPNPIKIKDKGIVPVAILGTEDFDVTQIAPASIYLWYMDQQNNRVHPLRWSYKDVATPYSGDLVDRYSCTINGPDGYTDLVLHFANQPVVAMLDPVNIGNVLILPLAGNLMEDYGGTPIAGADIVWFK
ncbi:MAG: hypothetical protein A2Z71_09000 [Chloroflexi bacterium RBG_13_50_21]|nr:MAG: hypothetical protein A2Z71_09000 [Chloroflexi bacterium RBG_13_50_21]